jgi:hypothetical protein
MGREIKRVPMDFSFPLDESYGDHCWSQHRLVCPSADGEDCDCYYSREPPKGEGWQLWQTVSDGPLSPVFKTPEELINWMCEPDTVNPNRYCPWAKGYTREQAEALIGEGWVVSMVVTPEKGPMSGVDYAVDQRKAQR